MRIFSFFRRAAAGLLSAALLLPAASAAAPSDLVIRAADSLAGDGVVIAVIDSGFDPSHPAFTLPEGATPALTGASLTARIAQTTAAAYALNPDAGGIDSLILSDKIPFAFDYAGKDFDVADGMTVHGTHVAALAAAGGTAEGTLPGAAPAAQLLFMKVFDDSGLHCEEMDIVRAVRDAVTLGADVINLSLGSLAPSEDAVFMPYLSRALEEAREAGILVVAAAGNDGETGIGGVAGDRMRTDNPDTGLPSEPAILAAALSVAASLNAVVYDHYLIAGEARIRYALPAEAKTDDPTPADILGTDPLPLVAVPGVGRAEDFSAAPDLTGKIALIRRGEITFTEKIENATEAGAVAVIIVNSEDGERITMSAEGAGIPAVLISFADGEILKGAQTVAFSSEPGTFSAEDTGIADFSARGPAADMKLTVDVTAVGGQVLSAVGTADGGTEGYDVLSGTSMAAPQIAGLAAAFISARREYLDTLPAEERADAIRAHLASAAVPVTDADTGLPVSPRAQGAGQLILGADVKGMTVTLTGETGLCTAELSDRLTGECVFPLTVQNTGTEKITLTLTAVMTTEGYETAEDGVHYVTGRPEEIPGEIRFSADGLTVPPGESRTVTVTLLPDADFLAARQEIFPNGFYLEGFITAASDGVHIASLPFFGFFGDWDDAPILDGGDWDGYISYYGGQKLLYKNGDGTLTEAGDDSALFAFSPNGDGVRESVLWRLYPLRHAAGIKVEIFAEDETRVAEYAYTSAEKSYYADTGLLYHELSLWDGTDALNDRYIWPDGKYTVRLTVHSFTVAFQTVEIPITVDTEAPTLTLRTEGNTLTAEASDEGALTSLTVYLPDPENSGENLYETAVTRVDGALSLTASFPDGADYLYIRAEDAAGNVTVTRAYAPAESETESAEKEAA